MKTNSNPTNNKDNPQNDEQWVAENLQGHLNAKVDALDFNVTSKLSAARHRALASEQSLGSKSGLRRKWFNRPGLIGSAAVLSLAVFLGTKLTPQVPDQLVEQTAQLTHSDLIEDMNMLSASEDLEFFESMEFLEWMESNSS